MPRKRKAARAFRPARLATIAAMRKRFPTRADLFFVTLPENFFTELPTAAERQAFAGAFPHEFYELFGFFSHASDEWPASTMFELRGIFRRPRGEYMRLLKEQPPQAPFDPPDVEVLPFRERNPAIALARGQWWQANGWPMSKREAAWLNSQRKETEK